MIQSVSENLKALGCHVGVASFFEAEENAHLMPARVISEHRGGYRVHDGQGEYDAVITGTQNYKAASRSDYPAIGDWVGIDVVNDEQSVICATVPRNTLLERKRVNTQESQIIAANVDFVFVVEAVGRDFNFNRIERYLVLAKNGGCEPVIIFNKIDDLNQDEIESILNQAHERFPDIKIFATSVIEDVGMEKVSAFMQKEKTYCFIGSSGVGKSSIINYLLGGDVIKTKELGTHAHRGVHTTTSRSMYFLDQGAIVIDNPGMREVGVMDVSDGMREAFSVIDSLGSQCKFNDCAHDHEPGCAIQKAIVSGEVEQEMYDNYLRIKKESDYSKLSKFEKRRKDKQFGKHIKSVVSQNHKRSN